MTNRHRLAAVLFAATLSLCAPGAPLRSLAGPLPPTHLRPVQSKADCAAALSLVAVICDAAVKQGDLQLVWNEPGKSVDGYKVFQVDGGGHRLLGTSTSLIYVVKKPPSGYGGTCYAVEAYAGSQNSADSARYCYAPGATAQPETFGKPTLATVAYMTAPTIACKPGQNLLGSEFVKAIDTNAGSAFSVFLPEIRVAFEPTGIITINRPHVVAGTETAILGLDVKPAGGGPWWGKGCSGRAPRATVQVKARSGVAFDLRILAKHKVYSASLTLDPSQTVSFASGRFTLAPGGRCPIRLAAASQKWTADLNYARAGRLELENRRAGPLDVTKFVSGWASHDDANDYGFIVASDTPWRGGHVPNASNACLTEFASPSLRVVYF